MSEPRTGRSCLGKLRTPSLVLFELEPFDLSSFHEKATLEISHVNLRQVLVLTHKDNGRNPEFFRLVLLQPVPNDLRLSDVRMRCISHGIAANENIHTSLIQLLQ